MKTSRIGLTILAGALLSTWALPNAHADITDFGWMAPASHTEKFVNTLDRLGHEKPRTYNYNGTEVFFSVNTSKKTPRELFLDYQQEFVRQGVNDKVYPAGSLSAFKRQSPEERGEQSLSRARALLTGNMIPLHLESDGFVLGGATIKGNPKSAEELEKMHFDTSKPIVPFHELFGAHHYVQADWDPLNKITTVTASWGDENFDAHLALPKEWGGTPEKSPPDTEVPTCIGCERLSRFAGIANERPYVYQIFKARQSAQAILNFYEQALTRRGWAQTDTSRITQKALKYTIYSNVPYTLVQYARNREFVTIGVDTEHSPDIYVSTFLSD